MEIAARINQTFSNLLGAVKSFNEDEINYTDLEGSWTPGQVVEHLLKANSGIVKVLKGRVIGTSRDPEEKIPQTNAIFLDFTTKMQSPPDLVPTGKEHERSKLLASLEKLRDQFTEVAQNEDLSMTCLEYSLPGMGEFTRKEWINFGLVHSQRHTSQLEEIRRRSR